MSSVLDPQSHSSYFDEIRSFIDPEHDVTEDVMPNSIIAQFGYLGRAEVAVLRAANETSANLRPANNDASLMPDTPEGVRKRELVLVIEGLTAIYLLSPQTLTDTLMGRSITTEHWDIDQRKQFIQETVIAPILPEVLTPASSGVEVDDEIISVIEITGTY